MTRLSRRSLLQALTALTLPVMPAVRARASAPVLPPDLGKGRSIATIGAGVAGLTAGWMLARHGFKVTIFEADSRYGGRSLSPRSVRKESQDWWFSKYDPARRFRKMYVSQYHEDPARRPSGPDRSIGPVGGFLDWRGDFGGRIKVSLRIGSTWTAVSAVSNCETSWAA